MVSYANTSSHVSDSSEPQSTLVHSRNLSTISSATLHTSTTLHSQPYEPLLRPITPGSGHYDVVSRQSRPSERILSLPRWSRSQSNVMSHSPILDEKKEYVTERKSRTPGQMLRWSKKALETIMAIWSIYSTIRYLLAFTIYDGQTGQLVSVLLGICTGLSFAFSVCSTILNMTQTILLMNGLSVQALITLRSLLRYLSSLCFLAPSIVNLVLSIVWKKTKDTELQAWHRCRLDVDLIWSIPYSLCNHKTRSWGLWMTVFVIRIFLSLIIIISFHFIASSSHFAPPRKFTKSHYIKGKKSHVRLESEQTDARHNDSQESVVMPQLNRDDPIGQQQMSDSSGLSNKSSPRNRLRTARSQLSAKSGAAPSYDDTNFLPMGSHSHDVDIGMTGFVDRFRSLISQITRETEDGLAFAQSDSASSTHQIPDSPPTNSSPELDIESASQEQEHYDEEDDDQPPHHHYDYDDDDDFYSPSQARAVSTGGYQPAYPEDERIHMLNGIVRRMPTIESMGSREMRSSLGASSTNTNRDRRPPTRNARLSWTSSEFSSNMSEPRSRPNSLSAQAELLAGMFNKNHASEVGELAKRGETVRMVGSPAPNPAMQDDVSEALGEYDSTTSGSKETMHSFHTASTGSSINSLKTALRDAAAAPFPLPPTIQSPVRQVHPDL